MIEIGAIADMRRWRAAQRRDDRRVGLVPTMGFLHEGHLRLVDHARARADRVVVSVFVNPAQFGPHEDLDNYPRDLEHDRRLAAERGTACLFLPTADEMYPRPAAVTVAPGPLAAHLCGPRRPGHFAGVLLVVLKLFHIVEPDHAVFGRKDAQQATILRRMVTDLDLPIEMEIVPTVREADGLALSSRNAYLTGAERHAAATIPRALDAGHHAHEAGARDPAVAIGAVRAVLDREPLVETEYVEAVDPDTLQPVAELTDHTLLAVAARLGTTRLIDNIAIGSPTTADVILAA